MKLFVEALNRSVAQIPKGPIFITGEIRHKIEKFTIYLNLEFFAALMCLDVSI